MKDIAIVRRNITGTINFPLIKGVLNFPLGISVLFCSISTPPQTRTKANKVPMLHKSVTIVKLRNKEGMATKKPVTIVANEGV